MRILRRAALPLVVVLLVVAVAAEVGGRIMVERIAEQRLRDSATAGRVEVVVGEAWWRPSVLPTVFGADLDRAAVRLRDAQMFSVTVAEAEYVLDGLEVSVSLRDGTIGASSVARTRVRMSVDPTSMGDDLGIEVTTRDGQLLVGEQQDPAELTVRGSDLVVTSDALSSEGGSTTVPLIDPEVFPCVPTVRVVGPNVELSCAGDRLPAVLGLPLGPEDEIEPDDLPLAPVDLEPPVTLQVDPPSTTPTTREGD